MPFFGSRYTRKPIKGSKDSDDSLVSKNTLSKKIGLLDWRPGPGKVGQKMQQYPTYGVPPQRTQNWKKISVATRSLTEPVDGSNTPLALSTGKLWLNSLSRYIGFCGPWVKRQRPSQTA